MRTSDNINPGFSIVAGAAGGQSIEQIETAALNTAKTDQLAVLAKAGSGVVQTVIAGIKASTSATK